jgi:hypothetical protein
MDPELSLAFSIQMGMLHQWFLASPIPDIGQHALVHLVTEAGQARQKLGLYWEKKTMVCGREV